MARKTVFLGSSVASAVDVRGPLRPSWPDVDILMSQRDVSIEQLAAARAIALASETDWDVVRVYFSNGDCDLLIPGRLLFVPPGEVVRRIEPITPAPATRLYSAAALAAGDLVPSLPAGVVIDVDDPLDSSVNNRSGFSITVYQWTGAGFDAGTVVAANTGFASIVPGDGTAGAARLCDLTVDKRWSIADLILAGLIKRTSGAAETRALYVSASKTDMHGNPGDPTQPTTIHYTGPTASTGGGRFADLSPKFYGRLAVDVFDTFPVGEVGGHPYRPRLAPARWLNFGLINVAATTGAPAAPDQALVTVPIINASSVEFLCRNAGGADLYLVAASPAPDDLVTGAAGVRATDPPPATQWNVIAPGAEGSVVIDDPRHPFCKILMGAAAGGTQIAAGAVLTIKRQVIE